MSEQQSVAADPDSLHLQKSSCYRVSVIVLACAILGLALIYPFSMSGRGWTAAFNLAHAPAFCLIFLLIVGLLDPAAAGFSKTSKPLVRISNLRLVLLSGVLLVCGVGCEYAQKFVDRQPSVLDVVANCAGLLSAALFCFSRQLATTWIRAALLSAAVSLLLVPSYSPMLELFECFRQSREFPLLASFERSQELQAWLPHSALVRLDTAWSTHGVSSMKIEAADESYPGNLMMWPVKDWREYSFLEMDLYNPGDKGLTVGINIGDALHYLSGFDTSDRYGISLDVPPSSTRNVRIDLVDVTTAPATRKMTMSHVTHLDIYMTDPVPGAAIHVDNIRLTK